MTSRTAPGVAAMSMLDSVRSAMARRLQRPPLQGVLELRHHALPAQRVPAGLGAAAPTGRVAAHVVVEDHAVTERFEPDLHRPADPPVDGPPLPLDPPV